MQYFRIKNWEKLQHYRDRATPWIKLYGELLDSTLWVLGSDASKLLAMCTMILAVRQNNQIPFDPSYVKRICNLEFDPDFTELIDHQFIEILEENESASKVLASCYQDASGVLAKCTSAHKEVNKSLKSLNTKKGSRLPKEWLLPKTWGNWAIANDSSWTPDHVRAEADKFRDYWIAQPGRRGIKLDWEATWRNWCRNAGPMPVNGQKKNGHAPPWWNSDAGIIAKGQELGLPARPGEEMRAYRQRINERLNDVEAT